MCIAWAREGLAPFKVPRYVEFRDELPKTPSGKIHKAALKSEPQPLHDACHRYPGLKTSGDEVQYRSKNFDLQRFEVDCCRAVLQKPITVEDRAMGLLAARVVRPRHRRCRCCAC